MSHLASEVRATILGIFAALAIASLVSMWMRRRWPDRDLHEFGNRIRTWWAIVGLFFAALAWSPQAAITFLGFASFLALKEFLSMTPTRRADRRVLFYAYLSVIVQYYLAATARFEMFMTFIPILMLIWLPTRMWMIGQTEGFLRAAGTLHWALMVTVFSLSHAALLLVFEPGQAPRLAPAPPSPLAATFPGPGLLIFLLLFTASNDIFQSIWGKSLGGRKLAPNVNPGKTYAGLIGGVTTTVALAAWVGPRISLLDAPRALLGGMIIAIGGLAGDMCISALKRDLQIKDFGATLPGHGGVLDRIDSLVFTAPLFFHFVYYCYG